MVTTIKSLLIATLLLVSSASFATPKISLPQYEFDFGTVTEGEIVHRKIDITNKGTSALEIQKITPGCGCTVSNVADNSLEPGESTPLTVAIDTQGFSGKISKNVFIISNDEQYPTLRLVFSGQVRADVVVDPSVVDLGRVTSSVGSDQRRVKIISKEGNRASEVSSGERISARVVDGGDVVLTLNPGAPVGDFKDRIVAKVVGLGYPIVIPVIANVTGNFWIEPSTVGLGVLKDKTPVTKTVVLHGKYSSSPKISTSNSSLTAKLQGVSKLQITFNPKGYSREEIDETVTVSSNDEEVVVPVFGVLAIKK